MKSHIKNILAALSGLTLAAMLMVGVANAQGSPGPKESPDSTKSADTKATDAKSIQNVSTNPKKSYQEAGRDDTYFCYRRRGCGQLHGRFHNRSWRSRPTG